MFAIFRLFSMLTTVIAFFRTPTGRQLIERARMFISNRAHRDKATEANKARLARRTQS